MQNIAAGIGLLAIGLVAACGGGNDTAGENSDGGNSADGNSEDSGSNTGENQQVQDGPISFEVPEDWEEVPLETEPADVDAWSLGYADDLDLFTAQAWIMPNVDFTTSPDASTALSKLFTTCRLTDFYPSDCEGSGRESIDIPGADQAVQGDFSYTHDDGGVVNSRFWVAVDTGQELIAAVEYGAVDADEAELDAFGETITFDASQAE